MEFNFRFWVRFALFNLLIVALFGLIMRYKIGFEFPHFNQKNLQHAHSHFAFSGWISMMIMVLMLWSIKEKLSEVILLSFRKIFIANVIIAYGMLFAFSIEGYAFYSITFSTLSIFVSFWFSFKFYSQSKIMNTLPGVKWLNMAMLFNILSTLGTFSLSYMMASKQMEQHTYLSTVYWYLHFQYNGWFFFACMGLFVNYLFAKKIVLKVEEHTFKLFAMACLPTYGLSVLWLNLPIWVYIIIIVASVAQFYGLFVFLRELILEKHIHKLKLNVVAKLLLLCVVLAIVGKVSLQLGSTVPVISKFAFGFRPIVIAYLHLVLLAFTSVFLIAYAYVNNLLGDTKTLKIGLMAFVIGIVLNELLLAVQGIFSITYTKVPLANEMLFIAAVIMFCSLVLINISLFNKKKLD
jgi:hypothetical protein